MGSSVCMSRSEFLQHSAIELFHCRPHSVWRQLHFVNNSVYFYTFIIDTGASHPNYSIRAATCAIQIGFWTILARLVFFFRPFYAIYSSTLVGGCKSPDVLRHSSYSCPIICGFSSIVVSNQAHSWWPLFIDFCSCRKAGRTWAGSRPVSDYWKIFHLYLVSDCSAPTAIQVWLPRCIPKLYLFCPIFISSVAVYITWWI